MWWAIKLATYPGGKSSIRTLTNSKTFAIITSGSSVAQWQSDRLLTGRLQVRVLPGEPIFMYIYPIPVNSGMGRLNRPSDV